MQMRVERCGVRGFPVRSFMLTALLVLGCGEQDADGAVTGALEQEPPCPPIDASLCEGADVEAGIDHEDAAVDERPEAGDAGFYVASVTANGTGCRAGTWYTELKPDGSSFTTHFSAFEAEVDPQRAVAVKNCQISVKIVSPQGLSFALKRTWSGGDTFLEEGASAQVVSSAYFQGHPVASQAAEVAFVGPKDDTFVIENARSPLEPVWSPCGVERALNLNTTLRLLNTEHRKRGFIDVEAIDGVELMWRRCSPGTEGRGMTPATNHTSYPMRRLA